MGYRKTNHKGVSAFKQKNGTLVAEWRDPETGRVKKCSLTKKGFNTKTQAAEWLRDKSRELIGERRDVALRGRKRGVGDKWNLIEERYFEHFAAEHGKESARITKRDWFRRWRLFRTKHRIPCGGDLTVLNLSTFRDGLATGNDSLAEVTRNRTIGAVKTLLNWARDQGYLRIGGDDIASALKPYKVPRKLPRVLSRSELKRLIDAVVNYDLSNKKKGNPEKPSFSARYAPLAPFAFLGLLTGARSGEVLSFKWEDLSFEKNELQIWGSKVSRERAIPLHDSPALTAVLKALKLRSAGSVHICGDWAGQKPKEIHYRQWKRVIEVAGIDSASKKALRSTCIAHVASASTDSEYLLEARFGHSLEVSKRHYRKPIHGLKERGETVEEWLGVSKELFAGMARLGLIAQESRKTGQN